MDEAGLRTHLLDLGGAPRAEPLSPSTWQAIGLDPADLPGPMRWLLDHFAGTSFAHGAAAAEGAGPELGWLLDPDELVEAWQDTRDCLPEWLAPIENDGADNHLCVDVRAGGVYRHVHDAPLDRHVEPVSGSLEEFLWSLRPTEGPGSATSGR